MVEPVASRARPEAGGKKQLWYQVSTCLFQTGWWLSHPSEKYESQLG